MRLIHGENLKMINFALVFVSCFFLFLFVPAVSISVEESDHPEVILIDRDGNEISLESNIPYSPKNTCGECHDYEKITNAYHFQLGRTDAKGNIIVRDDMDSKNPWLISLGMYGKW
jgi:hypothetical protein